MNSSSTNGTSGGYGDSLQTSSSSIAASLPLLASASNNGSSALANSTSTTAPQPSAATFYPGTGNYGVYSDPGTPSTASGAPYSFLPSYNPYSAITPQLDINMFLNPWSFVDIGSEVPFPCDQSTSHASVPSFFAAQTLSSPHNPAAAAAAAMTRYTRSAAAAAVSGSGSNQRRGGRRPREEYDRNDITAEDRDKRDKRRQRNKEAAARCRQRRLDLMQTLQAQKDELEHRNTAIGCHLKNMYKMLSDTVFQLREHDCAHRDQLAPVIGQISSMIKEAEAQQIQFDACATTSSMMSSMENSSDGSGTFPSMSTKDHRPTTLNLKTSPDDLTSPDSANFDDSFRDNTPLATPQNDPFSLLGLEPSAKRPKYECQRPTSLLLTSSWQPPAAITPSMGMESFIKSTMTPTDYNLLDSSTFLTPMQPTAVSVPTTGAQLYQVDDLQSL